MTGLIICVIILIFIILGYIIVYNSLVKKSTEIDNAWSQIDVQLQRRNDLIPNLVSTVKGYAHFEQSTLVNVIKMRGQMVHLDPNTAGKSLSRQQMIDLSHQISNTLKSIFAVSERYPTLKANSDFQQLINELTNTENKIAYSRQLYNQVVASYNASIQSFPNNLIARKRFSKCKYLEINSKSKQVPQINL